ncbi:MAG TPA: nucleoside hydrolase [Actinomycetes bacterium]|nr:nucleoside hydrolase [Actinomycetes bacterium]
MHRLHVDTDIGGDPDDLAALALVAGRPDAELLAITTTVDPGGVRAGYARHVLDLLGLGHVPVAAGAGTTLTERRIDPLPQLWPADLPAAPSPPGAAVRLLAASVRSGATVVAIGPLTNLALLERTEPGLLSGARVVVMGGWLRPPGSDLPAYGPDRDWNMAGDPDAAATVLAAAGDLTQVTLADTLRTSVRAEHLPRLRAAGRVGALLARQAEQYAALRDHGALAAAHAGLPDDLLHFLHDPLTVATALDWPGVTVASTGVGRRAVTAVDGKAFAEWWLSAVELSAQRHRTGRHDVQDG